MLYKLLLAYFLLVNAAAFILMMADKIKAKKNRWRIKESTLMLSAALGGSIGAGMARIPMECFEKAMRAFVAKYGA